MEDPRNFPREPSRRSLRFSRRQAISILPLAVASIVVLGWLLLNYGPTSFLGGLVPGGRAAAAAPKAYVGLFKDDAVAVIDLGANRVLSTIPIPPGPHGLVATPDGHVVYATSDGASTVSVIDTTTDKVTGSIDVGKAPHGLAITPDGKFVLVAVFGTSQVMFLDTKTNQIVGQVAVPSPHNIAISPDGQRAYIAAQKPGATSLVVLNVAARDQIGAVALPKTPRALNFSPDGRQLYFTEAGIDAVQVLDPATNQIVTQIPVGASPHHPLFTPKGDAALVVDQGPGELAILDPLNHTLSGTVPVGKLPHWIATSQDGGQAYVTNENSNDLSVIDLKARRVLATIPVGNGPRKIVLVPNPAMAAMPGMDATTPRAATTVPSTAAAPPSPVAATAPSFQAGDVGISIVNFAFAPTTLTIARGQSVVWTNNDTVPHTTTSDAAGWDSGPLQPGATFRQKFDQPGTFAFHCSIHPFMQGTVVVQS